MVFLDNAPNLHAALEKNTEIRYNFVIKTDFLR